MTEYLIDRCYGGPEEGGWWYDWREPGQSVLILMPREEAEALARRVNAHEKANQSPSQGRFSVIGGPDHRVMIEETPGQYMSTHSPHYE